MKQELREARLHIDPAYRKLKSDQGLANADRDEDGGMGDEEEEDIEDNESAGPLSAADAEEEEEHQQQNFDIDATILNLFGMTYNAAPNSVNLLFPSWKFAGASIETTTLATYTAEVADRCLKRGKSLALNVSPDTLAHLLNIIQSQKVGIECCGRVVVEYSKVDSGEGKAAKHCIDLVLLFRKGPSFNKEQTPIQNLLKSNDDGDGSEWDAEDTGSDTARAAEFLMKQLTKEGDVVCDTVCSDPSFRRIASRLGRRFIGTEDEMVSLRESTRSASASAS